MNGLVIKICYYRLLFGFFFNEKTDSLVETIINGRYCFPEAFWKNVSQSGKDFISQLLQVNPQDRMSAEEALNHPWIQSDFLPCAKKNLDLLTMLKEYAQCSAMWSHQMEQLRKEEQEVQTNTTSNLIAACTSKLVSSPRPVEDFAKFYFTHKQAKIDPNETFIGKPLRKSVLRQMRKVEGSEQNE